MDTDLPMVAELRVTSSSGLRCGKVDIGIPSLIKSTEFGGALAGLGANASSLRFDHMDIKRPPLLKQ
jgi:hypothetical protein